MSHPWTGSDHGSCDCQHPLASVVVCACELSAGLLSCLESIRAQPCRHYELLVVHNAAQPAACFVAGVQPFADRVLHRARRGVCAARNLALQRVRGDIVAFTDDDVEVGPDWLHQLLWPFNSTTTACVTGTVVPQGPAYLEDGRYFTNRAVSPWILTPSIPDWYLQALSTDAGFGCNMAFRTSFLRQVGGFPEYLGAGSVLGMGDEPWIFLEVLKRGFDLHHNPAARVIHFFRNEPIHHRTRMRQLHAGAMAFHLKLLTEDAHCRWQIVRKLGRSFARFLRPGVAPGAPSAEFSRADRMRAYLKGAHLFLKYRKVRQQSQASRSGSAAPLLLLND